VAAGASSARSWVTNRANHRQAACACGASLWPRRCLIPRAPDRTGGWRWARLRPHAWPRVPVGEAH